MELEFKSIVELYERLKPALMVKKREMDRLGYDYIQIEDIWNFFKESKWKTASNLLLYQMTDDIINADCNLIDNYFKQKLNEKTRRLYFEEV